MSVGAGLLVSNWGKLNDWWKGEETEKETKRMEELAKHTKEARQATEKLLTARSPEEKRPGAAIDKAIAEFGGPAVNREFGAALRAYQGSFGPDRDQQMVTNLVANVRAGDPASLQLYDEILRWRGGTGNIVTTLRTGKTQAERDKAQIEVERKEESLQKQAMDRLYPNPNFIGPPATQAYQDAQATQKALEAEAQAKIAETRNLSNRAAAAFDQRDQRAQQMQSQLDRKEQGQKQQILGEMDRILQMSEHGAMANQAAQMQLNLLSQRLNNLIAYYRQLHRDWNKMGLAQQNQALQNMGGP